MEGYEYFANGQLITIFSATNYCGRLRNNGAMLQIDPELLVTPKYIEPNLEDRSPDPDVQTLAAPGNRFTEPYFPFNPTREGHESSDIAGSPIVKEDPMNVRGESADGRRSRAWRALDGKRPPSPLRGSSPPQPKAFTG